MGDRALVVFHDGERYSPTVYLHWSGSEIASLLDLWRTRMIGRGGDMDYGPARFIGICHEHIDGNLSLGVNNSPDGAPKRGEPGYAEFWKGESPGDAGVFVVDILTGQAECFGGYGFGSDDGDGS